MDRWLVDLKESLWLGMQKTLKLSGNTILTEMLLPKVDTQDIHKETYLVQRNHLHISG